jgi:hypothetical protein
MGRLSQRHEGGGNVRDGCDGPPPLVGLAAFLPERILFPGRLISAHPRITVVVVTVPVVGFVAVLIALRHVQVWMGHIEKM